MRHLFVQTVLLAFAPFLFADTPLIREATPQEAKTFLASTPKAKVLDVRTVEEYRAGHIKGAVCIDVLESGFETKVAALDRKTPLLVHCRSGGRSKRALAVLTKLQFQQIVHLTEGMNAWEKAGFPVEKSQPQKDTTP